MGSAEPTAVAVETPIHILLIEDNPQDAEYIQEFFQIPGQGPFRLAMSNRLEEGIAIASKDRPDVVLLDLKLPDSSGIRTVERFLECRPDVPVIVLTGLGDDETSLQSIQMGAQDYLIKDKLSADILARSIRYAIRRSDIQRRLRESEERYRDIFDNASDMIVTISDDDRILYANPACRRILGFDPDEWAAMKIADLIHPDDKEKWSGMKQVQRAGGTVDKFEMRVLSKSGAYRVMEGGLGISLKTDRPGAIRAIFRDVTERRQSERMKDDFISILSHELRTPITVIRGAAESMIESDPEKMPARILSFVEMIARNSDRLDKTVTNVLALSRLESGRVTARRTRVDLGETLLESMANFQKEAAGKKIELFPEVPASPVAIFADGDMVEQVLSNLIANAMRYARSAIRVRVTGGVSARLSVTDDGPGIARDQIPLLFNKYVQIGWAKSTSGYKGTGLGLAICRLIVDLHGGEIWVNSEEGRGSTFYVSLPAYDEAMAFQTVLAESIRTARDREMPLGLVAVTLRRPDDLRAEFGPETLEGIVQGLRERLEPLIRREDHLFRQSGAWVIIVRAGPEEMEGIRRRIRIKCRGSIRVGDREISRVTLGIGIAAVSESLTDPQALFEAALRDSAA